MGSLTYNVIGLYFMRLKGLKDELYISECVLAFALNGQSP
jgi:hypothetical protein